MGKLAGIKMPDRAEILQGLALTALSNLEKAKTLNDTKFIITFIDECGDDIIQVIEEEKISKSLYPHVYKIYDKLERVSDNQYKFDINLNEKPKSRVQIEKKSDTEFTLNFER